MDKTIQLSRDTNWGFNTNNSHQFTSSAFQLYNYVQQKGSRFLTTITDSADLQTIGMAFYYSACFINYDDNDKNSVVAENAYYCLAKSVKLGNFYAATKLYNLLRINPELLLSKFNVIYDSKVDPIETMMFSRNPLNDQRREVKSYIQQVRFYLISKFFDVKQQKTRIAQDMIDYPGSQVISEINIILKSFSYDDAVKIGEEYFEQVFSQIGFTLLHH